MLSGGRTCRAKGKRTDEASLADHKGVRGWDTWKSSDANDCPKSQRRQMFLIFIAADKINDIMKSRYCKDVHNPTLIWYMYDRNRSFMGSEYLTLRAILGRLEYFTHLMKRKVKRKTHLAYKLSAL